MWGEKTKPISRDVSEPASTAFYLQECYLRNNIVDVHDLVLSLKADQRNVIVDDIKLAVERLLEHQALEPWACNTSLYHGTRSGALPGILSSNMMRPLLQCIDSNEIPSFSGMVDFGTLLENGVARSHVNFERYLSSALGWAERQHSYRNSNQAALRDNLDLVGGREEALETFNRIQEARDCAYQSLSPQAKSLVEADFPVIAGLASNKEIKIESYMKWEYSEILMKRLHFDCAEVLGGPSCFRCNGFTLDEVNLPDGDRFRMTLFVPLINFDMVRSYQQTIDSQARIIPLELLEIADACKLVNRF